MGNEIYRREALEHRARGVLEEGELLRLARRLGWGARKPIPYVQQTSLADCGAACLAMVLGHHGRRVSLDEVRNTLGSSREGAHAAAILRAGDWYGLRGRGVKIDEIENLKLLPRGSILHWRFEHFVVFDRLDRKGGAILLDPAQGRRRVSREELGRNFTGVALILEKGERFEPRGEGGEAGGRARSLRRFLREIVRSGLLPRVLAASVLVQALALALPLLIALVVDRVVPRSDTRLLTVAGAGMVGIILFHFLTSFARAHLLLHLRTRVDSRTTLGFLEHLVSLPYEFFQQRPPGDLMMRLNSNSVVREILTTGVLSGLLDGALVLFYLVLIAVADLRLGLLVLALGAARIVLFLASRHRYRDLMTESLQAEAESSSYQVQLLVGLATFKASGSEARAVSHWSNLFTRVLNASLARGRLSALVDSALSALRIGSPLIVLVVGAHRVLSGDVTLGEMLALNALAVGFLDPLSQLVSTAFQLQLLGSYLERIDDVLRTDPEQEAGSAAPAGRLGGRITLDRVSFGYGRLAPRVLSDVSVEVPAGSFVALVGASGAGKSTLASLLVGLYRPSEGTILYDGIDLATLDLRSVRQQIGVVPQSTHLFAGTLRGNIALSDPSLPLPRIVEAARRAHLHEEIQALPMGYDTPVGSDGSGLSGGQRQRLALARALVHRPRILLLDEATSALDAVTEARIQRELEDLDCTRIVIAHRLSTIKNADLILVLDRGRIVEQGDHQGLLARGGLYAALVNEQVETRELRAG
jgi:ABC-type bacteriocin/lantibiotic exporter with double-glycine peptidase domain